MKEGSSFFSNSDLSRLCRSAFLFKIFTPKGFVVESPISDNTFVFFLDGSKELSKSPEYSCMESAMLLVHPSWDN